MGRRHDLEETAKTNRTPTEVLIKCLEDFGTDEPEEVVVIYKTKSGELAWWSNELPHTHFMGLLEMCKFWFLENRKKEEGD
jgi:hypothetical protein